ncbi:DUF1885 family protein [Bacillus sp. 1P06AnD]|uniref:DUF1885 family protein n=1 Tax=Bacillus sp. 1P06AnD TaxID=3132208 RepID=UPI0039A01358
MELHITESAYVKLMPQSEKQTVTIQEVISLLGQYKEAQNKTGKQVDWNYGDYSFPYEIKETDDGKGRWIYLSSHLESYSFIVIAIEQSISKGESAGILSNQLGIHLLNTSTFGDKDKANEIGSYLSKKLKGEFHLFNKRIKYDYSRK